MGDPVSWLVIEKGWAVISADGERVGDVHEVVGDTANDIFSGLAVSTGLLKPTKYVPAEAVGPIEEDLVQLTISAEEFGHLGEHDEHAG